MPKIQDISRSQLIWGLKFIVIGLGLWYIISYFDSVAFNDISILDGLYLQNSILVILVILIFSALNWFGEIKKWQILTGNLSFNSAVKQSLVAHGFSIFTPQKAGEFGAKCLFFQKSKHLKIIALSVFGQLTQLWITLFFGLIGLVYMFYEINLFQIFSPQWSWGFLLMPFVFLVKPVRSWCQKIILNIQHIKGKIKLIVLFWSLFRYLVFSHQFVLLLWVFELQIPYYTAFYGMSVVYFMAAFLPIFSIADALVKGSLALTIFGVLGVSSPVILIIISLMWISNTMIPALIGYVLMLRWQPKLLSVKA